jgi:hypothetical protein
MEMYPVLSLTSRGAIGHRVTSGAGSKTQLHAIGVTVMLSDVSCGFVHPNMPTHSDIIAKKKGRFLQAVHTTGYIVEK